MQIKLPCSDFYDAISSLRGISSSAIMPSGAPPVVKVSPGDGFCDFSAHGSEIDLFQCRCQDVEVYDGGELLLPVAKLFEISRNIGEKGEVSLKLSGSSEKQTVDVSVSDQKVHYSLAPVPNADFPHASDEAFKAEITIPQKDLAYIFKMVSFAMATHDPRNYLNGLYLIHEDNELCAVATNGHRLARSVLKVEQKPSGESGVILPRALVLEFEKNVRGGKKDGTAQLSIGETQVRVVFDNKTVVGRVLAGQFPDYKRVIPTSFKSEVTASREELTSALQKVSAILVSSPNKDQGVKLTFADNKITVKAQSHEGDVAEAPISAEYTGEEITIGLNNQYITDALKALQTEKISIQIQDTAAAIRIVGKDGGDDDYVIMPLRL